MFAQDSVAHDMIVNAKSASQRQQGKAALPPSATMEKSSSSKESRSRDSQKPSFIKPPIFEIAISSSDDESDGSSSKGRRRFRRRRRRLALLQENSTAPSLKLMALSLSDRLKEVRVVVTSPLNNTNSLSAVSSLTCLDTHSDDEDFLDTYAEEDENGSSSTSSIRRRGEGHGRGTPKRKE